MQTQYLPAYWLMNIGASHKEVVKYLFLYNFDKGYYVIHLLKVQRIRAEMRKKKMFNVAVERVLNVQG